MPWGEIFRKGTVYHQTALRLFSLFYDITLLRNGQAATVCRLPETVEKDLWLFSTRQDGGGIPAVLPDGSIYVVGSATVSIRMTETS